MCVFSQVEFSTQILGRAVTGLMKHFQNPAEKPRSRGQIAESSKVRAKSVMSVFGTSKLAGSEDENASLARRRHWPRTRLYEQTPDRIQAQRCPRCLPLSYHDKATPFDILVLDGGC